VIAHSFFYSLAYTAQQASTDASALDQKNRLNRFSDIFALFFSVSSTLLQANECFKKMGAIPEKILIGAESQSSAVYVQAAVA